MTRKTLFLNYATVLFAVPFVLFLVVTPIFWVVDGSGPVAIMLGFVFGGLFFTDLLFSQLWLYVMMSLCAFLLTGGMLIRLVLSQREAAWQQKRFYLLLLAIISVLAHPFLNPYQLPAKAIPGVEMQLVEPLNLITSTVKRSKERAEVRDCVPEPLGWADSETIVYRRWCGGYYHPFNGYQQGTPSAPQAYNVESKETTPFTGDVEPLSRRTCPFDDCVRPLLTEVIRLYSPKPRYPEHFRDAVISPDEQWVVFTAEHIYGPEDLLVIQVK